MQHINGLKFDAGRLLSPQPRITRHVSELDCSSSLVSGQCKVKWAISDDIFGKQCNYFASVS